MIMSTLQQWSLANALIDKNIILRMSEVFVKKLDAIGWDLKLCCILRQDWVLKTWWYLESKWDSKYSLIG